MLISLNVHQPPFYTFDDLHSSIHFLITLRFKTASPAARGAPYKDSRRLVKGHKLTILV